MPVDFRGVQTQALLKHNFPRDDEILFWEVSYDPANPIPAFDELAILEMQAAIGRIQLGGMRDMTWRRAENSARFSAVLARDSHAFRVPLPPESRERACYRLYAFVEQDSLRAGWDRSRMHSPWCAGFSGNLFGSLSGKGF